MCSQAEPNQPKKCHSKVTGYLVSLLLLAFHSFSSAHILWCPLQFQGPKSHSTTVNTSYSEPCLPEIFLRVLGMRHDLDGTLFRPASGREEHRLPFPTSQPLSREPLHCFCLWVCGFFLDLHVKTSSPQHLKRVTVSCNVLKDLASPQVATLYRWIR